MVTQSFTLRNEGAGTASRGQVRVALIPDLHPYQEVIKMNIRPTNYQMETDEHGNKYARFELSNLSPSQEFHLEIEYQIEAHQVVTELKDSS